MTKTVKISVSQKVAERLQAIVRERRGADDEAFATTLADEALTSFLDDEDFWTGEVQRIADVPRDEARVVSHDEVGRWIRSHRTDNPLPRPEGKIRS